MSRYYDYFISIISTIVDRAVGIKDPVPTSGLNVDSLRRINLDYMRAVDMFESQRDDTWKKMFLNGWREHYNAQVIMERKIEENRSSADKTFALFNFVKSGQFVPCPDRLHDVHPVGLSKKYMDHMILIESNSGPDTDGASEKRSIESIASSAMSGEDTRSKRVLLESANSKLFSCIQKIENERNTWEHAYMIQIGMHLEHQAIMEEEIYKVSSTAKRFIIDFNKLLISKEEKEIRSKADLDSMYSEVCSKYVDRDLVKDQHA